jgi:phosphatidylglycerophosphatase A
MATTSNNAPAAPSKAVQLATVFGLGYSPFAPGTAGALVGLGIYAALHYGLSGLPLKLLYLALFFTLLPISLWSSENAQPRLGGRDPQTIIIDEVVGQYSTFVGPMLLFHFNVLPWNPSWKMLLAGFLLFRLFDIWKPGLVSKAEKIPDARSIVFDDLAAAGYATLILTPAAWMGWLSA